MTIDQPLDVLLAHDSWATDQLSSSLRGLSEEQLDRPFDVGPGSLRATLIHMVDVIGRWHAALTRTDGDEPLDAKASVNAIAAKQAVVAKLFAEFARAGSASDVIHATTKTRSIVAPRGVIVTHVLTHGTHHRAQALNMLRQLGVKPLPPSSAIEWAAMNGVATMRLLEGKK